jgi:hypothetical protein
MGPWGREKVAFWVATWQAAAAICMQSRSQSDTTVNLFTCFTSHQRMFPWLFHLSFTNDQSRKKGTLGNALLYTPSILIYKQLFSFSHLLRCPSFMWKIIYMDKNNLTSNQVKHIGIEKLTNQVCTITFAQHVLLFPMFQGVDV